jgi:hypothetical protein
VRDSELLNEELPTKRHKKKRISIKHEEKSKWMELIERMLL